MRFKADGRITFICNDDTAPLLNAGKATVKRASHVEPVNLPLRIAFHAIRIIPILAAWTRNWKCQWRVNMAPSGYNVILGPFGFRSTAINAEIDWLTTNVIGR